MVSDLDRYVGRMMSILEEKGIADRTLVIFTSDNGPTHPQKGDPDFHVGGADINFFQSSGSLRGFKGSVYEGGIRVPMIARLPGVIPPNTTSDAATYFPDWFPTLCDAAVSNPLTSSMAKAFGASSRVRTNSGNAINRCSGRFRSTLGKLPLATANGNWFAKAS